MFHFFIVIQALIALFLVVVILMQQSEGGGLGTGGGSPSGLMSARGAANFMTRLTSILAGLFVLNAIFLSVLAARVSGPTPVDTSFHRLAPPPAALPAQQPAAAPAKAPASGAPDAVPLGK